MEDFYSMRLVDHMAFWCAMLFFDDVGLFNTHHAVDRKNDGLAVTYRQHAVDAALIFYTFGITRLR